MSDSSRPRGGGRGGAPRGGAGGRGGSSQRGGSAPRGGHDRPAAHDARPSTSSQRRSSNTPIPSINAADIPKPTAQTPSDLIVRGAPGTAGTPNSLLANYFQVQLPKGPFYQYSVQIKPEVDNPRLGSFLLHKHSDTGALKGLPYVYDGAGMLYTKTALIKQANGKLELVSVDRNNQQYVITIQPAATISSATLNSAVLQFFNQIYRRSLSKLGLQQIGRNFYDMDKAVELGRHKLKILPGLLSTIQPTARGALFNADVIFKSIRTDTVLDMLFELRRRHPDNFKEVARSQLSGTIVICNYNRKTVYINDIDWDRSPADTFERRSSRETQTAASAASTSTKQTKAKGATKGGRGGAAAASTSAPRSRGSNMISYVQYYKQQYNIDIRNLDQPLLVHRPKNSNRIEYFIPELCSLTGLTDSMRENRNLMKDMKDATGLGAEARARAIVDSISSFNKNQDFAAALREWDLQIKEQLVQVNGRVLPQQAIKFKQRTVPATDAAWNIRSDALLNVPQVQSWAVVCPENADDETINQFLQVFTQVSRPIGFNLPRPTIVRAVGGNTLRAYDTALRTATRTPITFVLVILPDSGKQLYDAVKQFCCHDVPVPSQCAVLRNVSDMKGLHSKATKLAVQVVSKIGGAPWTVDKLGFPGPTMVIGIDVYHSGEVTFRSKSSVVGFTASMDAEVTSFYSSVIVQAPGQELIDVLAPCVSAAMDKFKQKNGILPQYVIVYRDGVGEGQKIEVIRRELTQVLQAIHAKSADTKVNFTLVMKRIHTRLFQRDGSNALDNPAPGTVVDTDIVNEGCLEFFMVAQSVTQGTATPTRYQCIHNSANFGPNYLQQLTFKLCHMYFNWFGTVRVPNVCQYAHKLAFLAGQSLRLNAPQQPRLMDKLYYL